MRIVKEKIISFLMFINLLFFPVTKLVAFTKRSNSYNKDAVESLSKVPLILEHLNFEKQFGKICYSHSSHVSHSSHSSHASHSSGSHYSGSHSSGSSSNIGDPDDLSSGEVATYIQNNNYIITDPTLTNLVNSNSGSSGYSSTNIYSSNSIFNLGLNANFCTDNNFISLPLEVLFDKSIMSIELPYFIKKLIKDENELKKNSGFGDGLLRYGYKFSDYYHNKHTIDLYLKIPLGKYKNTLVDKLTPLGSGSTDFIFDYHFFSKLENAQFEGQIFYKFNTFSTQIYNDIKFEIKNGNILFLGGSYDYFVNDKLTLSAFFKSLSSGQGITKESSSIEVTNNQKMFLVDFAPQISYKIYKFDLILNINFPFVTDWKQKDSRKTAICFKIKGDLFRSK